MPNRLAFHDAAYSLPSVLKSSDVNEKMHIVANVTVDGYYMTEIRHVWHMLTVQLINCALCRC